MTTEPLDPPTAREGAPVRRQPWVWRKARGGFTIQTDPPNVRLFHAYDLNDNCACDRSLGLASSSEPPNEGSQLCPYCVDVVQAEPGGRP